MKTKTNSDCLFIPTGVKGFLYSRLMCSQTNSDFKKQNTQQMQQKIKQKSKEKIQKASKA